MSHGRFIHDRMVSGFVKGADVDRRGGFCDG